MTGSNVLYELPVGELLCRLGRLPLPHGLPKPALWQGAELPEAFWSYYQYLYPERAEPSDEDFGGCEEDGEDASAGGSRYYLQALEDPEDCYTFFDALKSTLESVQAYHAELADAEALTDAEREWEAAYPAYAAAIEEALRGEDFLIVAGGRDWYAGIRMPQLGMPDPPVWLSRRMLPSKWEKLTETSAELLTILLMEELSGGERNGRRYHRSRATPELLATLPGPPAGEGPFTCWLEEPGCALFLMRVDGELRGLRIDREHSFRSDDSWQSGYLLDHHLKGHPSQERMQIEPFTLAGCCKLRGLCELTRSLRGDDKPLATLEPFEFPDGVREFTRMDAMLGDISALAACTRLKELRIPRNRIVDLSPLRGLVNLRDLCLADNRIHSLEPLAGLTALGYLDLSGNPIGTAELEHLRKLKRLKSLLLNDTLVDDLSALQGFRGYSLELTGLPVLKNAEILKTRTRLQSLRLDLETERAQHIGELVPWLDIRVEHNGVVQLTSKAYYE